MIYAFEDEEPDIPRLPDEELARISIPIADEQLLMRLYPGCYTLTDENNTREELETDQDLPALVAKYKEDRAGLENYLTQLFWEQLNGQLDDPWINWETDSDFDTTRYTFGSEDDFNRLMRLFILTDPVLNGLDPDPAFYLDPDHYRLIRVLTATRADGARLYSSDEDRYWDITCYSSPRLETLVTRALAINQPLGWTWEYNDQAYNRESGHDLNPNTLDYPLNDFLPASFREIMLAHKELREWLIQEDLDPAEFLTPLQPVLAE